MEQPSSAAAVATPAKHSNDAGSLRASLTTNLDETQTKESNNTNRLQEYKDVYSQLTSVIENMDEAMSAHVEK